MICELTELGNPILRQVALAADPKDPALPILIQDLLDTLEVSKGMGIAAPQIGVSKRVFIVSSKPNSRYPKAPLMEPVVMVNPKIVWQSPEIEKDWEGCLSIPGIRGLVPRARRIKISYWDFKSATEKTVEYADFIARICQHENDHLDGVVFLDRAESGDLVTEKEYAKRLNCLNKS